MSNLQLRRVRHMRKRHFIERAPTLQESSEWVKLRETLMEALKPFPEARWAVAEALMQEAKRHERADAL